MYRLQVVYSLLTEQTSNICITFIQCWSNVEDVGPTLYKCYTNVLCLLGVKCEKNISVNLYLLLQWNNYFNIKPIISLICKVDCALLCPRSHYPWWMNFADFSVNSQPIFKKFYTDYFLVTIYISQSCNRYFRS